MANTDFSLLIPAAGLGSRMGGGIPKPFRTVGDRPLLAHTLDRFVGLEGIKQVVVVTTEGYLKETEAIGLSMPSGIDFRVVRGGEERSDSIRLGLEAVWPEIHLVVIHDAVRPFVNPEQVRNCLREAARSGAAILAVPTSDTVKRVASGGKVVDTPDRRELWCAQTPQIFRNDLIRRAYREEQNREATATDDASMVERLGESVRIVRGSHDNFKITWPVDFRIAEIILGDGENSGEIP